MSKKQLSKKDNQSDFTRGGQILFHNLRMLYQVSAKVFKIGILVFLFCLIIGIFLLFDKGLFLAFYAYAKAYFYALFNNGQSLISIYFNNQWGVESADSILTDPWFIDHLMTALELLIGIIIGSIILSIAATVFVTKYLKGKGKEQSSDKFLRGMELVEPKELTRILRKNHALAPTKIDNYNVLVKDFGVYQTLIDGTIGTGKSVLLMKFLKDIRAKGDRVVVYDKGCSLTPFFYRDGNDHLLNPFDARSELWNVWGDASELSDFQNIADALIPLHGQSDPFWVIAARSIFVSTAEKMKTDKSRSTYRLLSMLLTSTLEDISAFLEGTDAATLVSTKAQKTAISIKSILATYVKSLRFLAEMEEETNKKPFSIRNWVQDEESNRGSWLFLTSNTRQHASMRPLISVWLTIASLALLEMKPCHNRRIWFVVDEMPSLHAIPNLPETLAEVRKFGGCWIIGIQSYAQLRKTYGQDYAETIFDLLNTRFFFRSPSQPMAEISSKELGEQEVDVMKTQYSIGANTIRDGVSLGSQTVTRRVISPAEIMQLDNLSCYLRIPGSYPITKLKLMIDKKLNPLVPGFVNQSLNQKQSKKMESLELLIGDAIYGQLSKLDKEEVKALFENYLVPSVDNIESDMMKHQQNIDQFKKDKKAPKDTTNNDQSEEKELIQPKENEANKKTNNHKKVVKDIEVKDAKVEELSELVPVDQDISGDGYGEL